MTTDLSWRKSSYSSSQENCVEVAFATGTVGLRDSKNTAGPALFFSHSAFTRFLIERKF
ncbi:MAG: DUF397 domain-containing protein [Umezawaea sp.]